MKVLVITNYYPFNENPNSGIFVTKRLGVLKNIGVDFSAFAVNPQDDFCLKGIKKLLGISSDRVVTNSIGIEYHELPVKRNVFQLVFYKHPVRNALKSLISLDYFQSFSYDIIHAHGLSVLPAGYFAMLLSEKKKVPYVVTVHGSDINVFMKFRKNTYKTILERAAAVIFVSNALLEKAKSFGYSGKNAFVIPNGYDETIFKPMNKEVVREQLGIYHENYKYVGFVGNLIPIKRADKLGKIFHQIAQKIPKTYFIVAGDGPLREEIKKETEGLNIIFTGRIPQQEVAKWMNAMDVMVLPSRNEGWPCVVLEAQACGTCVIGSSNGGIPEAIGFPEYVVQEGENFEERFANKVVEVLNVNTEKEKLIEKAKNFAWKNIVKREFEIYQSLIESS
ncbi:MAG: glycosyltransferase family 4 protein [Fervidobacterium nodosum]